MAGAQQIWKSNQNYKTINIWVSPWWDPNGDIKEDWSPDGINDGMNGIEVVLELITTLEIIARLII